MSNATEQFAYAIIDLLKTRGCITYLTGGAARDWLLGITPKDWDLTTEASPETVISTLKGHFCVERIDINNHSFPVVLVRNKDTGDMIEVATFRKDEYGGTNDKDVRIIEAETIDEDCQRRDLTINAMYVCPRTGEIIDPTGGINDLQHKIIRAPGDPLNRFNEDKARIIRACRFKTLLEGEFDETTLHGMLRLAQSIPTFVKPERIRLEIMKVMTYPKPSIFLQAMKYIDALKYISPELDRMWNADGGRHHAETLGDHICDCIDALPPVPILRLAGLWHDIGKLQAYEESGDGSFKKHEEYGIPIASVEMLRLKFSSDMIKTVCGLTRCHMYSINEDTSNKAIRKMLIRFKEWNIDWGSWLLLKIADSKANRAKTYNYYPEERVRYICQRIIDVIYDKHEVAFSIKDLKISGTDIMNIHNIDPGPRIGQILNALFEEVVNDPALNKAETLCEMAKHY